MIREKLKKQEKENRISGAIILSSLHFNYNPVQELGYGGKGFVDAQESRKQQIIKNCLGFCAFSKLLGGSLLQKQARSLIEGRGVDRSLKRNKTIRS